jgi:DNA-binding response OmpR family regulator
VSMKVLIVEDDESVIGALTSFLSHHGYQVAVARTAGMALAQLDDGIDLVLLDLGLPDRDGFEVCRRFRERSTTPIIMATARDDLRSRIHGLNLGADDYIIKPYDARELFARMSAVLRRRNERQESPPAATTACAGRIIIDSDRHSVHVDGTPVRLTPREFDIIELLASRPGLVVRYDQIISRLWGASWPGAMRTLQVHMTSLRTKLGPTGLIDTVRGIGYCLREE